MRSPIVRAALAAFLLLAAAPPSPAQDAERRKGFAVEITSPVDNDYVLGKTRISARVQAEDPAVVERVEFLLNDELIFVDREAPYEVFHDFGETSKSWVIRAVAWHREGVSVSDSVVTMRLDFVQVEEVNRVLIWATVTDRQDNFVGDLTKDDFRVYEGEALQEILEFYPEDRPIQLAILLDTSGSMREQMREVHQAAGSFVDTLREKDKALILDFSDNVFLIQDLTGDHAALKAAIESTQALGGTALYDALRAAYRKLGPMEGRKAIVLLSDGEDTTSQAGFDRVLREARSQGILVYGIGLGGGVGDGPRRNVLKELSDATGGRAFFVGKASELAGVYARIAEELRRQYFLTYSTKNTVWDGRWVPMRVETTAPGSKVRARKGFFAVRGATK